MSRVNGKKPPAYKPATRVRKHNPYVVGCGAALGGYIGQGVPRTCGATGYANEMYLCRRCSENARATGLEVLTQTGIIPAEK